MSEKVFIYSTLTSAQQYGTVDGVVTIQGGANVSNKHLWTPKGVVTEVTESQLDALQRHPVFAAHCRNGFISISLKKRDVDQIAQDMAGADQSAQETPATMAKKKGRAPVKAETESQ